MDNNAAPAPKQQRPTIDLVMIGSELSSIADYIDGLATVVEERLLEIRELMRSPDCRHLNFADVGDWRIPEVMLSLIQKQTADLASIARRVEMGRVA